MRGRVRRREDEEEWDAEEDECDEWEDECEEPPVTLCTVLETWSTTPLNPLSADAEPADTDRRRSTRRHDQTRPQRPTAHPSTSGVSGLFPAPPPLAPEA